METHGGLHGARHVQDTYRCWCRGLATRLAARTLTTPCSDAHKIPSPQHHYSILAFVMTSRLFLALFPGLSISTGFRFSLLKPSSPLPSAHQFPSPMCTLDSVVLSWCFAVLLLLSVLSFPCPLPPSPGSPALPLRVPLQPSQPSCWRKYNLNFPRPLIHQLYVFFRLSLVLFKFTYYSFHSIAFSIIFTGFFSSS